MNYYRQIFYAVLCAAVCATPTLGQPDADAAATRLLDHLAGRWVMEGIIAHRQVTHDMDATWVLNHEYLQLHELSREKNSSAAPAYEAIVFISWDAKAQQYTCLWLDSTAGGGLSADGIARGKKSNDSIPLLFTISPTDLIHTTFNYEAANDTWQLLIDNEERGKTQRFADVKLTRVSPGRARSLSR
jgi:hypothetical protein